MPSSILGLYFTKLTSIQKIMALAYLEILNVLTNPEKSKDPDAFCDMLDEVMLRDDDSRDPTVRSFINKIQLIAKKIGKMPSFSSEIRDDAVQTVMQLAEHETLLFNQQWFLKRMSALGYTVDERGECFGMHAMAMQAFLADELPQFNARLHAIHSIPLADFENDFKNLRDEQKRCDKMGLNYAAKIVSNQIVDTLAFFDGITLHQAQANYPHLFQNKHETSTQEIKRTMEILVPVALESVENYPTQVQVFSSAYSSGELTQYLTCLKDYLGGANFSLLLHANRHAINLNYDAEKKRWLLIDPNCLPGEEYIHPHLLTTSLFEKFNKTDVLIMETIVCMTQKNAKISQEQCLAMQQTPLWQKLHDISKCNIANPNEDSLFSFALKRRDIASIAEMLDHYPDMNQMIDNESGLTGLMTASYMDQLDVVKLLIDHDTPLNLVNTDNENALIIACKHQSWDVAKLLIAKGCEINQTDVEGNSALYYACRDHNRDITQALLDKMTPKHAVFDAACKQGNVKVARLLARKIALEAMEQLQVSHILNDLSLQKTLSDDILHATLDSIDLKTIATFNSQKVTHVLLDKLDLLVFQQQTATDTFIAFKEQYNDSMKGAASAEPEGQEPQSGGAI